MEEKKCTFLEITSKFWHYLYFKPKICDKHAAQKKNQKPIEEFWNLSPLEITFCCFQSQ